MQQIQRSVQMPYSNEKIFALVNDIAAYPQFLPWCGGAKILLAEENNLTAEIIITKGPIRVGFTTKNKLSPPSRIDMQLVNGPFKQLTGCWMFEAIADDACKVSLQVSFEFSNRLLAMSVGAVFEQIMASLVDAFLVRAKQVYGK